MYSYYSLIILIFILAGAAAAFLNGRKILKSNKTKNWPSADATIIHKTNSNPNTAPKIYYTYQVSGNTYENKIQPPAGEETMPGFAEHFKKKYPDGEKITVFYSPDSPQRTLFSVGATTEDKLIFGIGIGAILLGLYAITV